MAHSTTLEKPAKPYPDFPLFPHATRRWAKKIRGKLHSFGPWDNPDAALQKYLDERDDLHAGRTPRVSTDTITVRELCNRFLTAKEQQRDAGDITGRTFADYLSTCKTIVEAFGKDRFVDDLAVDDFQNLRAQIAKTRNPNSLGNEVQRIRVVFKYGHDAELLDKPMRFGPTFKRPAKRILRALRQKKGQRVYSPEDLRTILDTADPQLKAMALLGINCGFGNNDCGSLPKSAIDLKSGWVNFPRPKTAIERRCPLWPETVEAIKAAMEVRPAAKQREHDGLVFITKYGQPWSRDTKDNPISQAFRKLLDEKKLYRPGLGFYALRHCFETIGGNSRDQVAVDFIMGHSDESMAGQYRENISDERLVAVSNHVHDWLFPKTN